MKNIGSKRKHDDTKAKNVKEEAPEGEGGKTKEGKAAENDDVGNEEEADEQRARKKSKTDSDDQDLSM